MNVSDRYIELLNGVYKPTYNWEGTTLWCQVGMAQLVYFTNI